MVTGTSYSGTILSGGSRHFKLAVPASGTATVTVSSTATTASSLRLLLVRTK